MEKTTQKPLDISTMTLEEIDKELEKGMRDIAEGRTRPAREFFATFLEEYTIYGKKRETVSTSTK